VALMGLGVNKRRATGEVVKKPLAVLPEF
jgi:hypothetical protein